jgi:hypothetical protein
MSTSNGEALEGFVVDTHVSEPSTDDHAPRLVTVRARRVLLAVLDSWMRCAGAGSYDIP